MLKCVDFFCGGGGMSYGMREAGLRVVAAIDNEKSCQATYEANHKKAKFLLRDITQYEAGALEFDAGIRKNDPSLVFIACAPCQYWSIIIKKDSDRKKKSMKSRNLLQDFLRFVDYYKPGYVVIENVRGIQRDPQTSGLAGVLDFLDNNGYQYDDGVLSVADYGVPQTRRRYVLLATRNTKKGELLLPEKKGGGKTVRDEISHLDEIAAGEIHPEDSLHRASNLSETNKKRLRVTPKGCTREYWSDKKGLSIDAYKGKPLSFFRDNYGRMSWDKPAPTITTRFYSIGCGRFGHPEQIRCISLREGALLQTFPREYEFKTTTLADTARIIGNAVPPEFAKTLGEQMVNHSEGNALILRKKAKMYSLP